MAVTHSNGGVKTTMGKESLTPWSRESCNGHANGQESKGASAVKVTESFLFPEHMRPTVKHDEFTTTEVPVIDLAAWGNRSDSHDDQDKEAAMASVVAQVQRKRVPTHSSSFYSILRASQFHPTFGIAFSSMLLLYSSIFFVQIKFLTMQPDQVLRDFGFATISAQATYRC